MVVRITHRARSGRSTYDERVGSSVGFGRDAAVRFHLVYARPTSVFSRGRAGYGRVDPERHHNGK